jgi:hypothetical protein
VNWIRAAIADASADEDFRSDCGALKPSLLGSVWVLQNGHALATESAEIQAGGASPCRRIN